MQMSKKYFILPILILVTLPLLLPSTGLSITKTDCHLKSFQAQIADLQKGNGPNKMGLWKKRWVRKTQEELFQIYIRLKDKRVFASELNELYGEHKVVLKDR